MTIRQLRHACWLPAHPLPAARLRAEFLPLPRLNAAEQENFEIMKSELRTSIQKGIDFMNK